MTPAPAALPSPDALRARILELARTQLHLAEELPPGELAASLDSVQRLTLVVAIEDEWEICFEPEDEAGVTTLDEVVGLLRAKLAEKAAEPEASDTRNAPAEDESAP